MARPLFSFRKPRWNSFTLIELLVVISIIAILAALTLAAAEAVMNKGARSRATAEIQAMSAALESYKADNGVYTWTNSVYPASVPIFASTNDYIATDPSSVGGTYTVSAQLLYEALSGKINFEDKPGSTGMTNTYMNFKANQLGNANAGANSAYSATGSTYVQDPWGYAYGYYSSSDTTNPPNNGTGFFDLWSTGGALLTTSGGFTNAWISNWQSQ
jgi:prepilin-type N-terminal cleavage/methylation domain-containing protein